MADRANLWRTPGPDAEAHGPMRHAGNGVWLPATPLNRPPRSSDPLIDLVAGCVILAAPRVWAHHFPQSGNLFPESIAGAVERYLVGLDDRDTAGELRAAAEAMRASCATWIPGPDLPAPLVTAAREVLRAAGQTPPVQGWDGWDGEAPLP